MLAYLCVVTNVHGVVTRWVEVREESLGKFPKYKDGGPGKGVAGGGMKFGESVGTIPKKTHKNGEKTFAESQPTKKTTNLWYHDHGGHHISSTHFSK